MATFDWRGSSLWRNLDDDEKWALMAVMEAGDGKLDQAKNVANAIYNRSKLLGDDVGKHLETNKTRNQRGYGWYQPLYERNQYRAAARRLGSKDYKAMLSYVKGIRAGTEKDTVGGATRYLIPGRKMELLSGGVKMTSKGLRGRSAKYYSWPSWTGYDPTTKKYRNETHSDGVHSFLIPDEDQRIAKRRGYDFKSARGPAVAEKTNFRDLTGTVAPRVAREAVPGEELESPEAWVPDNTIPPEPDVQGNEVVATALSNSGSLPEPQEVAAVETAPENFGAVVDEQDIGDVEEEANEADQPPTSKIPATDNFEDINPDDYVKTDDRFFNVPKTFDEAVKKNEEINESISWSEAADATFQTSPLANSIEAMARSMDPVTQFEDPNFKVTKEDLEGIDQENLEFLAGAKNRVHFEWLKAEILRQQEGWKSWEKATLAQGFVLGSASLIPEVAVAIAAGGPGVAAARLALARQGMSLTSRGSSAIIAMTDGVVGGTAEGITYMNTGQIDLQTAYLMVGLGAGLGGGVGGLFGGAGAREGTSALIANARESAPMRRIKQRQAELADDMFTKAHKTAKPDEPLPKRTIEDAEVEAETTGVPARPKVDTEESILINRDPSEMPQPADIARLEADVPTLRDAFNIERMGAHTSKSSTWDNATEAFNRHYTRSQTKQTLYVYVDETVSDLKDAIRGDIAIGFKTIDAAVRASARAGGGKKLLKVSVPAGSKVLPSDLYKGVGGTGEVMLGDGRFTVSSGKNGPAKPKAVKYTTPEGKEVVVETTTSIWRGRDKKLGTKKLLNKAVDDSGEEMTPRQVAHINTEHVNSKHAESSAGARENPNYAFATGADENLQDLIERTFLADKREHYLNVFGFDIPTSITRMGKLLRSHNPVTRVAAKHLMESVLGRTREALDEGLSRVRGADFLKKRQDDVDTAFINQSMEENLSKFKKWARENGMKWKFEGEIQDELAERASHFLRTVDEGVDLTNVKVPPGVKEFAMDMARGIFGPGLDRMKNPGLLLDSTGETIRRAVNGSENVNKRLNYVPRVYTPRVLRSMRKRYGNGSLEKQIAGAMESQLRKDGLLVTTREEAVEGAKTIEQVRSLARGIARIITENNTGYRQAFDALYGRADPADLMRMFRESDKFSEEELRVLGEFAHSRTVSGGSKGGDTARLKHRAWLDEHALVKHYDSEVGEIVELRLTAFTENNLFHLARDYSKTVNGRAALATVQIPIDEMDPSAGLRYDGFTSDAEIDKFLGDINKAHADLNLEDEMGLTDIDILKTYFKMMKNEGDKDWRSPKVLEAVKMFVYQGTLGGAGIPQTLEVVNAGLAVGFRNMFTSKFGRKLVREMNAAYRKSGADKLAAKDEAAREAGMRTLNGFLKKDMGIGTDIRRMMQHSRNDDYVTEYMSREGKGWLQAFGDAIYRNIEKGQNATFKYSGLAGVQASSHVAVTEVINDVFTKLARSGKPFKKVYREKLQNSGLNADEIDQLAEMYRNKDIIIFKKGVVEDINVSHPDFDMELFQKAQDAFYRSARQAIQDNDYGDMLPGSQFWYVKPIIQLKSFIIGTWLRNTVQNSRRMLQMSASGARELAAGRLTGPDGALQYGHGVLSTAITLFASMAAAGFGAYARQEMQYAGKTAEQKEEFRDLWLTGAGGVPFLNEQMLEAMVARGAFTSFIPAIFDNVAGSLGYDTFEGYRTSGTGTRAYDPAMFSLISKGKKFLEGVGEIQRGEADEDTPKKIQRLFTNLIWIEIVNSLVSGATLPQGKDVYAKESTPGQDIWKDIYGDDD